MIWCKIWRTDLTIGARRLMTYRRLPDGEVCDITQGRSKADDRGISADELNEFRRKVCIHQPSDGVQKS